MKERFSQPAFLVYQSLEDLMLKAIKGEETSTEMKTVLSTYSSEVSDTELEAQLATFRGMMRGNSDQVKCFNDILDKIKSLNEHERYLIGQVVTFCLNNARNPSYKCNSRTIIFHCETFENVAGSQMVQSRFNDVCILNTHKKRLDDLLLVDIVNQFILFLFYENRTRNFGKMSPADLTPKRKLF